MTQAKAAPRRRVRPRGSDLALKAFAYAVVAGFALVCLYPLLLTLSVSLTSEKLIARDGFRLIPKEFTLDTYTYIFAHSGRRILQSYGVTLLITIAGTLGAVLVTTMVAFALSIKSLKYRGVIAFLCNFTLIFSSGIVPWYVVCVNWYGFQNNLLGLVVPSLFSVWQMFLMGTYFSAVPASLYGGRRQHPPPQRDGQDGRHHRHHRPHHLPLPARAALFRAGQHHGRGEGMNPVGYRDAVRK